jgi:myosin-5
MQAQLGMALTTIRASRPHYVRCLKPNDQNRPAIFTRPRVLNQLRYSGVVEVVRARPRLCARSPSFA